MAIDKKLKDTEFIRLCSWGKVLSYLKKQFDEWATERLSQNGYKDFRMVYMPVIMNIDLEGTNNNELAKRARVTKQAMSKVIKELQSGGYISSKVDPKDKRSIIFFLTERGKKIVLEARLSVKELMDEYRVFLGKTKFDAMLQTMLEIVEYNDQKLTKDA
jgi:DNA-binding MarR family transcriptional regulator